VTSREGQAVVVELISGDPVSGVDFSEYRINQGPAEQYEEPLVFTENGMYEVQYRAADKAGNYSEWKSCDVWVSQNQPEASIISSATVNGLDRNVLSGARNGMPVIRSDRTDEGGLINLPVYALGGEYPLWDEEDILLDETSLIRLEITKNAVVYLFLPRNTEAPQGWSFVAGDMGINKIYYPGGTTLYMRRYNRGDVVELGGTKSGTSLPFIIVQERGNIFAEIEIKNTSEEIFPVNEYEAGADLVLEAVVSPWSYSRRLPLKKQWLMNAGDGWIPLDDNHCPAPQDPGVGYLRLRLELYTPDGQMEYRAEKTIRIIKPIYKEEEE
jgi:hypothetical protein